jgi:hypothetical protein
MDDNWYFLEESGEEPSAILAYDVHWESCGNVLLIQMRFGTGAIVRHLFPRGTLEQVTSISCPGGNHQVCLNPSFLTDSVLFEFASGLEALRFHWTVVTQMKGP